MPNPIQDGITHINVYSKGKTELGRFLSNFCRAPFTCADGRFESIEGYWYWLGCPDKTIAEGLRHVSGFEAKKLGRSLRAADWQNSPEFKAKILAAMQAKLDTYPRMKKVLAASALSFEHYYVFGTTVHDERTKCQWMLDFWAEKRKELQTSGG